MGRAARTRSSFDRYLREIGAEPLLTREEEVALARRIRRGDDAARHRLVSANLRFVVSVAKRHQHRGVALADLVNEGNLGLLRAAERFDESRGVRFISYAVWWVRQAMTQAIARGAEVRTRGGDRARMVSLEAPLGDDRGARLGDVVPDAADRGPEEAMDRQARRHAVDTGLVTLPHREQRVLRLYFGLDDGVPRTLGEIGRELGVSRERIRQIKDRGLARLRVTFDRSGLARDYA